jgi:CRP/FNR family transcriptional regulator, cyclic AMP receptor protein
VIQEFIRASALFRDLDDDDLAQVLMVSVIRSGKVRISKVVPGVGEEALTILEAGDFFGEFEFFDGAPASAHAIAHADCEVLSIPHGEMKGLVARRPETAARFLWAFGYTLARRLRETNQKMAMLFAITRQG